MRLYTAFLLFYTLLKPKEQIVLISMKKLSFTTSSDLLFFTFQALYEIVCSKK